MKNKKGFTLIELLGVIVLLAVIALIAFLVVDGNLRSSKEEMREIQFETIELAAKNWASDHLYVLPENVGKYSLVSLGTLKIGGYLDVNILDPITKKCFPNDAEVKITKFSDNYVYTLQDKDSINYGYNCSNYEINKDDDEIITNDNVPVIRVDASTNTIKNGEEVTFIITSTEKNIDTSKIKLKHEYLEDTNGNESRFSVFNNLVTPTAYGYELTITVVGGDIEENIWLEIEAGAVTNANSGISNIKVESNKVLVDNVGPKVILRLARTWCNSGLCSNDFLSSNDYYNMSWRDVSGISKQYNASYNVVMEIDDGTDYFEVRRTNVTGGSKLTINNIENLNVASGSDEYVNLLKEIYGENIYLNSLFYDNFPELGEPSFISISDNKYMEYIYQNGTYIYEFCDANGNCSESIELGDITEYDSGNPSKKVINEEDVEVTCKGTCSIKITNKYNDDYRPVVNKTGDTSVLLKDYWRDPVVNNSVSSGISYSSAFIASSNINDVAYLNLIIWHYLEKNLNWSFVENELINQGFTVFKGNENEDVRISSLISSAANNLASKGSCGTHYLWLVGIDNAKNINYDNIEIQLSMCSSYQEPVLPVEPSLYDSTGSQCDIICQMARNSIKWNQNKEELNAKSSNPNYGEGWHSTSQEAWNLRIEQELLHKTNESLCELEPTCHSYSPSEGVWYNETGSPLYTVDDYK